MPTDVTAGSRVGRSRVAAVLAALAVPTTLAVLNGAYIVDLVRVARDDPKSHCAAKYDSQKTSLRSAEWTGAGRAGRLVSTTDLTDMSRSSTAPNCSV